MILISACPHNNKSETNSIIIKDTLPYPHITILTDLPDSNKPRQIVPEKAPQPLTIELKPPVTNYFIDKITKLPIPPDAQGIGLFTTYTTDDGVSFDQIYCSYKDKNGNLWFGTNGGGISKYDGKSFINYTTANGLSYNLIWSIIQDSKGNLWVGTDGGGVSKYDGKSFTNYTTVQGLAHNVVYSIMEDKIGNLWFGTKDGVSKYDGKGFANYTTAQGLSNNYVSSIEEDNNGNLWFGTKGGGISKYDGRVFSNYTTVQGLANNTVNNIFRDKAGNLWIGTDGGGVSKYNGKSFTNYSIVQGLAGNVVYSIKEDTNGNLWFGTKEGVSKYDGKNFTNYNTMQGLANNIVRSITEDEKGNIWFGTFGGGISKFSGKSITNFTTAQGLANNVVYSIIEDKIGNLWFGTNGGGVSKYDGKSITNYTRAQGLVTNVIYSLAKDSKGNIWFGTYRNGVIKYDGKQFTNYTTAQGLANNTVFRIVEDKYGNLWFGTSGGGVSKYDGKQFTNYTTAQGLANNVVFSMLEDRQGNLWFGTLGGGVSKFDGKSFTNYTTAQGLTDNAIWTIAEDKSGDFWFGTQNGLNLMRLESIRQFSETIKKNEIFSRPLFESFTTKEGLPHNFITQVVQGNDQKLYIGTNLGICELIPLKTNTGIENKWGIGNTYNALTGYPIKDVNSGSGAMFIDSKGIIWIGTGSDKTGLVRFDPQAAVSKSFFPPKVVIKSIKINNENISWSDLLPNQKSEKKDSITTSQNITEEVSVFGRVLSDIERDSIQTKFRNLSFKNITRWHPIPEKLVLPYYYNSISFDFNAIETGKNFLVKYQHKLEGYDNTWSPPGKETSVSFGNIYEGTYTFILKAQSPEGIWSEPVTYTFEVLPPWWRTWWAYASYVLFLVLVIYAIIRWRTGALQKEKKLLEEKVNERTSELKESLDHLKATQSQLIQSEKMASLGELTAGIAHEIQNPLNFVNNFSEVNNELIEEIKSQKLKSEELDDLLNDIFQNNEKINHHGKRADAIVKGMLQHSRSSTEQKEQTDINALADEYLRLAYHGFRAKDKSFNATMKTDFDKSIGNINIVPQDMGRVILNLITNAFYVVSEKKKSGIDNYEPTVSVSTKKINGKVEIKVKDNGNGIPESIKEKIFQPFFTTKPAGSGTGLGLSLSYDILKAHGGDLKVETKEGEYAEFIIIIPV